MRRVDFPEIFIAELRAQRAHAVADVGVSIVIR
jgi:hypothetical protein